MSLVSEAIGFLVLGILIIASQHQADLNGLATGSAVAIIGGLSALLVGTVLLVSACLHWRFCARYPAALPVRCQLVRFTFAWPEHRSTGGTSRRDNLPLVEKAGR
jgi:hypothetical protein